MRDRSRSTLFLIEQLIVVAVFAICAAACAGILTSAYFTASDAKDLSNAILAAENGAETFKAVGGDLGLVARMLDGAATTKNGSDATIVYYDSKWLVTGADDDDASYTMLLVTDTPASGVSLITGELTVENKAGEVIITFPLAVRGSAG